MIAYLHLDHYMPLIIILLKPSIEKWWHDLICPNHVIIKFFQSTYMKYLFIEQHPFFYKIPTEPDVLKKNVTFLKYNIWTVPIITDHDFCFHLIISADSNSYFIYIFIWLAAPSFHCIVNWSCCLVWISVILLFIIIWCNALNEILRILYIIVQVLPLSFRYYEESATSACDRNWFCFWIFGGKFLICFAPSMDFNRWLKMV